jgi:hypothetical protein
MSLPVRTIPIILYDDRTGIISVQWFNWASDIDTRLSVVETKSVAGSDLANYQAFGAL